MQKRLLAALLFTGTCGLFASHAPAQVLFTTTQDFAGWGALAPATSTTPSPVYDYDDSTTNGLGDNPGNSGSTLFAGQTSPGGSLQLTTPSTGYSDLAYSPGEAFNPAYMHAIDPGSLAAYSAESGYGSGSTTAHSGTIQVTYTIPTASSGSYFELGLFIKYDNHNYNPLFGTITSDGTVDGQSTYTDTMAYTIDAGTLTNSDLEIFSNSDYVPTGPIYVDDINVVTPEPASLSLVGLGGLLLAQRRRK